MSSMTTRVILTCNLAPFVSRSRSLSLPVQVETVADRYIAVTGLPKPREQHAVIMATFAAQCSNEVQKIVRRLEQTLGPGTCELGCKFG